MLENYNYVEQNEKK